MDLMSVLKWVKVLLDAHSIYSISLCQTSKHVWNDTVHILHIFVVNTIAYHLGKYSLHLLILKRSMGRPVGYSTSHVNEQFQKIFEMMLNIFNIHFV